VTKAQRPGKPGDVERQAARRLAARALGDAGRRFLGDLGMCRRKSSPRLWWLDRGWWLINVEFQPSSWSVGSYLNVGLQHLWAVCDHRTFEYSSRVPIGGRQFVDLVGAESEVRAAADAAAQAARQAVRTWVARLPDDDQHLRWLRDVGGTGWDGLNSAIAAQLSGQHAKAAFAATAADLDRSIEWQRDLADDCHHLAALSDHPEQFRETITGRVSTTRAHLKLTATPGQELPQP
jgi:hypothetical protein